MSCHPGGQRQLCRPLCGEVSMVPAKGPDCSGRVPGRHPGEVLLEQEHGPPSGHLLGEMSMKRPSPGGPVCGPNPNRASQTFLPFLPSQSPGVSPSPRLPDPSHSGSGPKTGRQWRWWGTLDVPTTAGLLSASQAEPSPHRTSSSYILFTRKKRKACRSHCILGSTGNEKSLSKVCQTVQKLNHGNRTALGCYSETSDLDFAGVSNLVCFLSCSRINGRKYAS